MKNFDPLLLQGLPYKNGEVNYRKLTLYKNIIRFYDALVLACFALGIFSIPFESNPLQEYISTTETLSLCAFSLYIILSMVYIYLWSKVKIAYDTQKPLIVCDFNHREMGDKFWLILGFIAIISIFFIVIILSFINICFLSIMGFITFRTKIFCLKSLVLTQDSLILRYRFYGDYAISLESLIVVPENQLCWNNNKWKENDKSKGIWIARITRKDKTIYLHPIANERNAWFGLSNLQELYNYLSKKLDIDIIRQTEKPFLFYYKLRERQ